MDPPIEVDAALNQEDSETKERENSTISSDLFPDATSEKSQ